MNGRGVLSLDRFAEEARGARDRVWKVSEIVR
jgi:hypothetical protein